MHQFLFFKCKKPKPIAFTGINPRAQEQAEVLSEQGKSLGLKKASFIAADDEFGRTAVEAFQKYLDC